MPRYIGTVAENHKHITQSTNVARKHAQMLSVRARLFPVQTEQTISVYVLQVHITRECLPIRGSRKKNAKERLRGKRSVCRTASTNYR